MSNGSMYYRWWEFYLVRYFVGAVAGLAVCMILVISPQSPLYQVIFPLVRGLEDLAPHHMGLLAAVGLAFCYISSAPILVLHALRATYHARTPVFGIRAIGVPVAVIVGSVALSFLAGLKFVNVEPYRILAWVFIGFVFVVQAVLYLSAVFGGDGFAKYYRRLAYARAEITDSHVREYVETYRHLREHGNAFLILMFELGLGGAIYLMDGVGEASLALFLWFLPAAFVWIVGTYLEFRLVDP